MNTQETYLLIAKVLSGEASEKESKEMDEWRNTNPDHEKTYLQASYIWEKSSVEAEEEDAEAAWLKLGLRVKKAKEKSTLFYMRIAAVFLAVSVIGSIFVYLYLFPSMMEIRTAGNEIKQVELPDGSKVWLNENSSLAFSKKFRGGERKVELHGEAFFEVIKDPSRPFIIRSQTAITRVLGTSFNLEDYGKGEDAVLSVRTGRVAFSSTQTGEELILLANEKASITRIGKVLKEEGINKNESAWKDGKLIFKDALLAEVFPVIEKYYHVKLQTENQEIMRCHFTGEFVNASLSQVLDVISKTLQLKYESEGNRVMMKGRGCQE